jgi:hypothetical protein
MHVDVSAIDAALRKNSNKSRLNRLSRLGETRLERIMEPGELGPIFDEICRDYDFRQGAVNGCCPFREDERKRDFHLGLMRHGGLLHVAVLRVGDRVAAAHLGVRSGRMVSLGVITHSTSFANHSPGKLLILLLGRSLAQEGIETFDLTPGGDAWKERFANAHDEVALLTVHSNLRRAVSRRAGRTAAAVSKHVLSRFGITPQRVRSAVLGASRITVSGIAAKAQRLLGDRREMRIYRIDAADVAAVIGRVPDEPMKVDDVGDLLCFEPSESWHTRRSFLAAALVRLEGGEHVYTHVENGRLVHHGWLIERQAESFVSEVQQRYRYAETGSVVYDFYTLPACRGRGFYRRCIVQMLGDAVAKHGAGCIYISVLSTNLPSRHVIEKLGFRHVSSLTWSSMLRWQRTSVSEAQTTPSRANPMAENPLER